jgi:predicted nucleic acid-binding protein
MDANVLIDFCESDPSLIKIISDQIGTVHVPTPVLEQEVNNLQGQDWVALGIVPLEPSMDAVLAAADGRPGLSFHDLVCLCVAKENGLTCVTNDTRLRKECDAEGVPILWGLELLALLVDRQVLGSAAAIAAAEAIHRANPAFITQRVLGRFRTRVRRRRRGSTKRRH